MNKKKIGGFRDTVTTVIYAGLIALAVRTFAYEPFNIPSSSMVPTLLVGDYLFVSKVSYGYSRHSFPFGLAYFDGRFWAGSPERGDVVVFKLPSDDSTDYIKRVIGLPGDRIQVLSGVLYINDVPVPKERIEDYVEAVGDYQYRVARYRETLPNGASYVVLDREENGNLDNTEVFVVPEGHYFMMGDNRDNSADSRAGVGYVPLENLVGKAKIIFFSTDGSARFWQLWKWPFSIRYGRLGALVD
ncbi:MAG: signal peptidase I [Proteobacteria bacterium]|nr:signal peptidase I [Pseudomonadota bacterium]